jgi:hypothetical protein
MAVNKRPLWGVRFKRGIFPLKIGPIAPFLDTIQPLSSTRDFLVVEKKRRPLCMAEPPLLISPLLYNISLNCTKDNTVVYQEGIVHHSLIWRN